LFAYGILKVLYAPHKAFKEIIQSPKYVGPLLIMILFTAAYVGYDYVRVSKLYDEQTLPSISKGDEWTENSTFWTSNVVPTESNDALQGGYYGNKSIEFSVINDTHVWMQLNATETINCSGLEGYKNVSFRIEMIYPDTIELENASLRLFSSEVDYFEYALKEQLASLNRTVWNNMTIPVGPESEWRPSSANASWDNITRLKLELAWSDKGNFTVRIDGLCFRGVFKPRGYNPAISLFDALSQFTIKWVLLGGLLYLVTRGFGAKPGWKPMMILAGFALVTIFAQAVINGVTFATLPKINLPLEFLGGVGGENEIASNQVLGQISLVNQLLTYVQMVILVWIVVLCALATHLLAQFSWGKSFLVSVVAYLASTLIASFIIPY